MAMAGFGEDAAEAGSAVSTQGRKAELVRDEADVQVTEVTEPVAGTATRGGSGSGRTRWRRT